MRVRDLDDADDLLPPTVVVEAAPEMEIIRSDGSSRRGLWGIGVWCGVLFRWENTSDSEQICCGESGNGLDVHFEVRDTDDGSTLSSAAVSSGESSRAVLARPPRFKVFDLPRSREVPFKGRPFVLVGPNDASPHPFDQLVRQQIVVFLDETHGAVQRQAGVNPQATEDSTRYAAHTADDVLADPRDIVVGHSGDSKIDLPISARDAQSKAWAVGEIEERISQVRSPISDSGQDEVIENEHDEPAVLRSSVWE